MMQSSFFSACCLSRFMCNRLRRFILAFLHHFFCLIYRLGTFVEVKNKLTNNDIFITN